jgi:outer membrane protein assembly factor BamB
MAQAPTAAAAGRIWLQAQAVAARTRLAPTAGLIDDSVLEKFENAFGGLVSAGDLTGNGRKDVLDERFTFAHNQFRFGATARDGRTGRVVWTRRVNGASRVGFALKLAPVGMRARPGLLVGIASAAPVAGGGESVSLSIQAWSGKTGKTLWMSAPVTGTVSKANRIETDTRVPRTPEAFHARTGAEDVLVSTETSVTHPKFGSRSGSVSATLINGRNGNESTPYSSVASTSGVPRIQPAGDLSGDGRNDVLAIVPGSPGSLIAEAGNTGKVLWRDRLSLGQNSSLASAGRISERSASDLILQSRALRIIRGRDGKVLFFRTKHTNEDATPFAFGIPAGPHGVRAVAMVSTTNLNTGNRFGAGLIIRAVTATGHLVWRRKIATSMAFSGRSGGTLAGSAPIGDVQPDGSTDLEAFIELISGRHHKSVVGIVSGRDGSLQRLPHASTFLDPAAGSLVHGAATDLLAITSHRHAIRVTGFDGQSGRRLTRTLVPTLARSFSLGSGLRLTGHGCSDIGLIALGKGHGQSDVLSGGGSRLWQIRYGESRATGGRLVTFASPKHFCAS